MLIRNDLTLFRLGGGGGKMAPLRVFAEYFKNRLTNLHQTLRFLRQLYRSSFKIKNLGRRSFVLAVLTNSWGSVSLENTIKVHLFLIFSSDTELFQVR